MRAATVRMLNRQVLGDGERRAVLRVNEFDLERDKIVSRRTAILANATNDGLVVKAIKPDRSLTVAHVFKRRIP